MTKTSRPVGRPSKYTPELVSEVADRLSEGEPLAVICRDAHMPDPSTIWSWEQKNPEISQALGYARDAGETMIAWRSRSIIRGGEGSTGDVLRDKYIVDHDLKLLAVFNPKKWAPRQRTEITGADGGAVVIENHQVLDLNGLDESQRSALREILETARGNLARDVTPKPGFEGE